MSGLSTTLARFIASRRSLDLTKARAVPTSLHSRRIIVSFGLSIYDETRKGFWIDEECAVHGVEIKEP